MAATKAKKHKVILQNCRHIYPWWEMEVGDYFVCPNRNTVSSAACWIGKNYVGMKFTVIAVKDEIRCYRVEA